MKNKLLILSIAFFLPVTKSVLAQIDLKNTGILYISHSSDILFINGEFNNTSTAAFSNAGALYVKEMLTNDQASMAVGTGTLYLNGTAAQSVSGSEFFKTYNLVTDNVAGITLNNSLSISGTHTFTNGLIASSATPDYLVYEAGSSCTGATDSRHATGWVKKYGSTNFTFPVGNNNYLRTVTLNTFSGTAEINCHYYTPTQNIYDLASPLVQVKANEYWQVDKIAGGTARIVLNWENAKVKMDNVMVSDVLASRYNGTDWTDAGGSTTATGTVPTTGTVTSNIMSSFGTFTFGYKTFPVPLKLISFTAERKSGTTYLAWISANEQSVDHFDIERSYDATNYSVTGTAAATNTSSLHEYHFEDRSSLKGFAWYRIRSVDVDGKFSYTKISIVSETDLLASSFMVMNPVRSDITIFNKTGKEGLFNYRLVNQNGQLIMNGNINMSNNGGALLPLPMKATAGIYILELSNDKTQFRQKILVER